MTQREIILKHLDRYKKITSWQAIMEYGITKVNCVVYHLRQDGYVISTENKEVTTRLGNKATIAVYTLISKPQRQTAIQWAQEYDY